MFEDLRLHYTEHNEWCVEGCIKGRWYRHSYVFGWRHRAEAFMFRLEEDSVSFEADNWQLLN